MASFAILLFISFLCVCTCTFWPANIKVCLATYHFWRPFTGSIPADAYLAGVDRDGDNKYISRAVGTNNRSWLSPSTISEKNVYPTYLANPKTAKCRMMEILSVQNKRRGFGWRAADLASLDQIMTDCCLVEGGSGYNDGNKWITYVGRVVRKGKFYIGGVTPSKWWQFLAPHAIQFVDEMGKLYGQNDNFEVLAYDCCTRSYCAADNKADCCYDIM